MYEIPMNKKRSTHREQQGNESKITSGLRGLQKRSEHMTGLVPDLTIMVDSLFV